MFIHNTYQNSTLEVIHIIHSIKESVKETDYSGKISDLYGLNLEIADCRNTTKTLALGTKVTVLL